MGSNPEFIFLNIYFFKKNKRRVWAASEGNVEVEVNDGCIKQTDGSSYYIWQYFTVSNSSETKKGGAKIAACKFCDKIFRGCCSTRLTAQILRRLVLGQTKAGIQTCIAINKKNDDGRAILKNAQQALCEVMREKEEGAASKSDQLDWSCASKAKAGVLQNETVWANAAKMPPEALYEMYVKQWHPALAMVGMRVLSQLESFSCPRVSDTGPLTDTSRRKSTTSSALKKLRNLFMLTSKWRQLSAMPTSSRCLLGIMKMCSLNGLPCAAALQPSRVGCIAPNSAAAPHDLLFCQDECLGDSAILRFGNS